MFVIKLAGLRIRIENQYSFIERQCRDYFCEDGEVDFSVSVTNDEILEEQKHGEFSEGYCESICMYRNICEKIAAYNVFLMHSSVLEVNGYAYAFTAKSGVGKSTQAALWEQIGASIRNGDRALLRKVDGKWETWGAPFAGTSGIYENKKSQLSLVALLEQGATPAIAPLTANAAMKFLYPETAIHHWDRNFVEQATDLLLSLSNEVPLYRLTCTQTMETVTLLERQLWHPFP